MERRPGSLPALVAITAAAMIFTLSALRAQEATSFEPARAAAGASLRKRGLDLGYNLDHEEALSAFRAAIAAGPTHPAAYRLVAATIRIQALFRQGAVTAADYLGQTLMEIRAISVKPAV